MRLLGTPRYSVLISVELWYLATLRFWRCQISQILLYMLVISVGFTWQPGERGFTAYVPPNIFCMFQKCPSSDLYCDCNLKRLNVFESGITMPGHSEVSLAAVTMSCRLQLRTDFGGWAGKLRGHYCTYICTYIHIYMEMWPAHWTWCWTRTWTESLHFYFWAFRIMCLLMLIIPMPEFATLHSLASVFCLSSTKLVFHTQIFNSFNLLFVFSPFCNFIY